MGINIYYLNEKRLDLLNCWVYIQYIYVVYITDNIYNVYMLYLFVWLMYFRDVNEKQVKTLILALVKICNKFVLVDFKKHSVIF